MVIKRLIVHLLFFLCLWPLTSYAWIGKVVNVTDGDTIKVLHDGKQVRVRLYGIDTPEKKQAYGKKATKFTADMVAGETVEVEKYDIDRYGRTVGVVTTSGKNLNEELIKAGFAWVYRQYCDQPFCSDWLAWQRAAKSFKKGLWKDKEPLAPWAWRERQRKK